MLCNLYYLRSHFIEQEKGELVCSDQHFGKAVHRLKTSFLVKDYFFKKRQFNQLREKFSKESWRLTLANQLDTTTHPSKLLPITLQACLGFPVLSFGVARISVGVMSESLLSWADLPSQQRCSGTVDFLLQGGGRHRKAKDLASLPVLVLTVSHPADSAEN